MIRKLRLKHTFTILFFGIFFGCSPLWAQEEEPTDDLGNVSDAFQEYFFEALKQRAISNHELALEALLKAEKAAKGDPENIAVVNFQIAKNLVSVRRFDDAIPYFEKVIASQGDRLDVMEAMYDLYYQQRDYKKAIPLVEKLVLKDEDYKEDLANLYHRTKQYDKALSLLDELDDLWGESTYRNTLRRQIYKVTGNTEGAISDLQEKIDKNPKKEQDYLNLIFLYSEQGDTQKAFETAKELLKNDPNNEMVHFALYKFYLDAGDTQAAMASMKKVFASKQLDKESQYKVLGDFIQFVQSNPEYEDELQNIVALFSEEDNGLVYEKLGDFYRAKGKKEQALAFYEQGIAIDKDNFSLLKNTLLLQIDFMKYANAAALSSEALEIFPSQPLLYLINGVANNNLQKTDEAIESLETGLDYILDNPVMEKDYYEQLQLVYSQKGNTKKADQYAKKAASIQL